jgi:hypothetical protein
MQLPVIQGFIRRRLLVNFRVDAGIMERFLHSPFRPKLHGGFAIAGICLIRLEQIRPIGWPAFLGMASENAAHRIAVCWDDNTGQAHEGVFIPRRDTGSWLNHLAGGRIFPGQHHLADFGVKDDGQQIQLSVRAADGGMRVTVRAREAEALPSSSCFASLEEASQFFEGGSLGYSATRDCCRLDGLRLQIADWKVRALTVDEVDSSFFSDKTVFPHGSVEFDHALLMRDVPHRWHRAAEMELAPDARAPTASPPGAT